MAKTVEADLLKGAALAQHLQHAPEGVLLPSGLCAQRDMGAVFQAVDESKMEATFVIVTDERNRQGNSHQITATKLGQGLRTDLGFETNPVVLFDHGFSGNPFPVAMSSRVSKTAKAATATARFPEKLRDFYPGNLQNADMLLQGAAAVFAGVAEGMLRMSSIGFSPILAMLREQEAEGQLPKGVERVQSWRGLHFVETELREWSITAIGADRGALKQSLERGKIHDVRLPSFLRQSFQAVVASQPDPVTVPVGVDVAQLGRKVDRLARMVRKLARGPMAAQAGAGGAAKGAADTQAAQRTDGTSAGKSDGQAAAPVATQPQVETIAPSSAPKVDGRALADAFLQSGGKRPVDVEQLEKALTGVIQQTVGAAVQSVEQLEREVQRRMGRVV